MKIAALYALALTLPAGTALAQYGGYDYYQQRPQQLREYIDTYGNRVIVDSYGDIVEVIPPAQRPQPEFEVRRDGFGNELILEGPVERDGRYGGYDRVPVEPNYNDYRSFPPPPGGVVERNDLPPPSRDYGVVAPESQFRTGPRPYTPPATATVPPAPPVGSSESTPEVAALQIFLDRAGISPGVIDGLMGSNVRKAMEAYERKTGAAIDPDDVDGLMEKLAANGGLPIKQYTITEEDVAGPFLTAVPADYAEKAELEALSYTSPAELIAERFHMDEGYLRSINPNADFNRPGTVLKVANVAGNVTGEVARIVADKARKQVFAYGADGDLIAAYPATIGSQSTPSPTGTHTVERIAIDPEYTYNPKINFQQGDNDQILTIPPGPNGPVGSVWIALSKPTYGVHGTPEPSAIGKTESNGCIRLTNWDAQELAKLVETGVTVEFVEGSDMIVSGNDEPSLTPAATAAGTTLEPAPAARPAQQPVSEFPPARPPAIEGGASPPPSN